MNDEAFLKKFKGRFETMGKEGIIGIMKTAHIEIIKDTPNQYQKYSSSKTRTKPNKKPCSIKNNISLLENKENKSEVHIKKGLIYNKNNSVQHNKIFQNNKPKNELQLPFIQTKIQHSQINTVFSDSNSNNNKNFKDKNKRQQIKPRKGSVDDVMISKIKKETNNANNLTIKIQKLLKQKQENKKLEGKMYFKDKIVSSQALIKSQAQLIKKNKINKSYSPTRNIEEKSNLKNTIQSRELQIKDNNNFLNNLVQNTNSNSFINKSVQPQFIYQKKNNNQTATKEEFERLSLQRQSYKYFLPCNSTFK